MEPEFIEARDRGNEPGVKLRRFVQVLEEEGRIVIDHDFAELRRQELLSCLPRRTRRGLAHELQGRSEPGIEVFGALLLVQPVLVTSVFPIGKVHFGDAGDGIAETSEDLRIGDAVEDEGVDLVANGCWQSSDFTFAAMGMVEERVHGGLSFGGGGLFRVSFFQLRLHVAAGGWSAKREGACTLYYIKEARNGFAPSWRTIFLGFCVSNWYDDEFF